MTVAAEPKVAALLPPFVEFHGFVPTGDQLVDDVSQVELVAPVQL